MKLSIAILLILGQSLFALTQTDMNKKTILVLGDSISAGYGLDGQKAWPHLVEKKLNSKGYKVKIMNGSISGSTTSSAYKRLNFFLKSKPHLLLLALGANDGLRGIPVEKSHKNLDKTIQLAKKHQIKTILMGNKLPTNYGDEYRKKFERVFHNLSDQHKIGLFPFLLKDVAAKKSLNLEDGIHPNEQGQKIIADNLYPIIEKALK